MFKRIVVVVVVLLVLLHYGCCDVKDCVRWCDSEYKLCVNAVAQRMPMDDDEYTGCHKEWERCEETCHMD